MPPQKAAPVKGRKNITARKMWAVREKDGTTMYAANDETEADAYRALGFDDDAPVSIYPVLVIDATPEAVEQMRNQVAKIAAFNYYAGAIRCFKWRAVKEHKECYNFAKEAFHMSRFQEDAKTLLDSLGLTAPRSSNFAAHKGERV